MGSDKALLLTDGGKVTYWERQWQLLGELNCGRRFLSVRRDQTWIPPELAGHVIHDEVEEAGPLAGIVAAWKQSTATHLIVLAVDLPYMRAHWFERLQGFCRLGRGAAGQSAKGYFEPLAAIYPRAWMDSWAQALAGGAWSLQGLLALEAARGALVVEPITVSGGGIFRNTNWPSDLLEGL